MDDYVSIHHGESYFDGQGASKFLFRDPGDLRIEDFNSRDGDMLVFDISHPGITSKEESAL